MKQLVVMNLTPDLLQPSTRTVIICTTKGDRICNLTYSAKPTLAAIASDMRSIPPSLYPKGVLALTALVTGATDFWSVAWIEDTDYLEPKTDPLAAPNLVYFSGSTYSTVFNSYVVRGAKEASGVQTPVSAAATGALLAVRLNM